jgi:hypothetical protein
VGVTLASEGSSAQKARGSAAANGPAGPGLAAASSLPKASPEARCKSAPASNGPMPSGDSIVLEEEGLKHEQQHQQRRRQQQRRRPVTALTTVSGRRDVIPFPSGDTAPLRRTGPGKMPASVPEADGPYGNGSASPVGKQPVATPNPNPAPQNSPAAGSKAVIRTDIGSRAVVPVDSAAGDSAGGKQAQRSVAGGVQDHPAPQKTAYNSSAAAMDGAAAAAAAADGNAMPQTDGRVTGDRSKDSAGSQTGSHGTTDRDADGAELSDAGKPVETLPYTWSQASA